MNICGILQYWSMACYAKVDSKKVVIFRNGHNSLHSFCFDALFVDTVQIIIFPSADRAARSQFALDCDVFRREASEKTTKLFFDRTLARLK